MRVRALACLALCTATVGCHVYNAGLLDASSDRVIVETGSDARSDAGDVPVIPDGADGCATVCSGACVDTQTDPRHCGTCENDCTALPGVNGDSVRCVAGVCDTTGACLSGRAHCSTNPLDGCETDITSASACGSCTRTCPPTAATCSMVASDGGPVTYTCTDGCATGTTRCGTTCTDTTLDADNCGLCGRTCTSGANSTPVCSAAVCAIACNTGFGDCDSTPSNGCERNLMTDVANCGACSMRCPTVTNGTPACASGMCTANCTSGFGNCDGDVTNGCEANFANNPAHCGSCGNACTAIANATATCTASTCNYVCNAGFTLMAGRCVLPAPRLRSPLSTTYVTRHHPSLTAVLPTGADGVRVEVCSDLACGTVIETIDATGASAQPLMDLAPGPHYWRAYARSGTSVASPASTVWMFNVSAHDTGADTSWGSRPDINADGLFDAIITGTGTAYLVVGSTSGLATHPTLQIPTPAGATQFGNAVAGIGDVNGDGFGDVAITAFGSSSVYIYHGNPTVPSPAPTRTLSPPGGAATFGISVSGAGDVNGDGYADLLVGASGSSTAYIYYGSAIGIGSMPASTLTAGSMGGRAVASAGDVNGDNVGDVIIGAPGGNEARVFLGRAGLGVDTAAPIILSAPAGASSFGRWVAGCGDGNGDGYADVLVTAPGSSTAYAYLGSSSGLMTSLPIPLTGPIGSTTFGNGGDWVPDADGDGFDEIVIGASGNNTALYWRGSAAMVGTPVMLAGLAGFGAAVGGLGDVNGDHLGDVIIGAPGATQAVAYYGGTPIFGTSVTITPTLAATSFGQAVALLAPFSPVIFDRRDPG